MSITKFSKNEHKGREIKRKLKVQDYVFEIEGKDIYGVYIIYSFDYVESTIYENGKKLNIIKEPVITIELSGKDKEGKEHVITKENVEQLCTQVNDFIYNIERQLPPIVTSEEDISLLF